LCVLINNTVAFSLLAAETADIVGKEELSISIRFIGTDFVVHEEFLGFVEIQILNAERIVKYQVFWKRLINIV
jgi:hypothetical protein